MGGFSVRPDQIVPKQIAVASNSGKSIALHVEGGFDAKARYLQVIRNKDFLAGLTEAVEKSGMFKQITEGPNPDYRLEAHIFDIVQPWFQNVGGCEAATVSVEIAWSFSDVATDVHWRKSIKTTAHQDNPPEGCSDPIPLVKATEMATKENIRKALEEIYRLTGSNSAS